MSDWTEKQLIDLYARHAAAQIGSVQEYRALLERYLTNSAFQAARTRIEEAAVRLAKTMDAAAGAEAELVAALRLLRRVRSVPTDLRLYHQLIDAGYRPRWTMEQMQRFERVYASLQLSHEFFFSFTNRYEVHHGVNPVNRDYKHFILRVLTPEEWEAADQAKDNLLAKAIFTLLCQIRRREGFFFPDTQFDNAVTEEKLERELQGCFVFIQLVQNVMFQPPIGKKNYCHWEYSVVMQRFKAEEDRRRHILFAVGERSRNTLLRSDDVHFDYSDWHSEVQRRDPPFFPEAYESQYADTRFREIRDLVEKKLAENIEEAWEHAISGEE